MNRLSFNAKGIQVKLWVGLVLLFLVCFESVLPLKGWAQSFQDTGTFSFSGAHNPLRRPRLRSFLPGKGLRVGQVQLHTFLGVAEAFTDNVFRTKNQRDSDFLTTIAPGAQAYISFGGKHSFLLDYRAAQFLYAKFSENNAFTQNGIGQMRLNFPGGLKLAIQGGHVDGFDRRGSALDSQDRDITKWRATNLMGVASLSGTRGRIRLRSRYSRLHYKNNGQDVRRDRKSARADLTGFVKVTQALSTLLGVNINNNTYDENKQIDSFSYGIFTGFELDPSRQLGGEVRIGYSILNFDNAPVEQDPNSGLSRGGTQQKRIILNGNLLWRPTTRQNINFGAFRNIRQSGVGGTSTFVQTGADISAFHRITNRLGLRGGGQYFHNKFVQSRTDNRFRLRIGLDYKTVQWLGFGLNYYFERRSSTDSAFDNFANTVSISVQGFI